MYETSPGFYHFALLDIARDIPFLFQCDHKKADASSLTPLLSWVYDFDALVSDCVSYPDELQTEITSRILKAADELESLELSEYVNDLKANKVLHLRSICPPQP